jgi:hypothetical protein
MFDMLDSPASAPVRRMQKEYRACARACIGPRRKPMSAKAYSVAMRA